MRLQLEQSKGNRREALFFEMVFFTKADCLQYSRGGCEPAAAGRVFCGLPEAHTALREKQY